MGFEGSQKDECNVLRRAHAGIVDRDSRPLRRRSDVSALCTPRSTCLQSNYVATPANGIQRARAWIRWRVSLLPQKISASLTGVRLFTGVSMPPRNLRRCHHRSVRAEFVRAGCWSNFRAEASDRADLLYGDLHSVSVCRWARVVSQVNSFSTPLGPRRE